ncbi:MAG TPA: 23S rRNA (adenine(2503)-C(2))-methyltransferase RlmN [Dermatophilaceae bacterium]|nr:23S rRNA (adenine(2503)-C(2))-methyltransferase RlmN [Dermatophilaceae bacterium]
MIISLPDPEASSNPTPLSLTQPQPPPAAAGRAGRAVGRAGVPRHLADLSMPQRTAALQQVGEPGFRAAQLSRHYFGRWSDDPAGMTDLPAGDRDRLAGAFLPRLLAAQRRLDADKGSTVKTVYRLTDGALIESVLMLYPDRVTVCISSQAGCGMNCPFCATGQQGLTRNLTTAEIVAQVVDVARYAGSAGRVGNVVFMGMGEALANYSACVNAIRRLVDPVPDGLGLSARGITVSTVGLVPGMDALAAEGLPVTLALSLHAPDDERRDELVPINRRWPVAAALDAARRYHRSTGRRVSIEYALIRDVNDQAWRAELLADLLLARGRGWVHVNPIPLNPTPGSRWTASRRGVQRRFVERLRARGIPTTVRDTRGRDIDGACGQLAGTDRQVRLVGETGG